MAFLQIRLCLLGVICGAPAIVSGGCLHIAVGRSQMSSFEQPHQTASDCEDPPQRLEGTAALKEPLSQSPDSQNRCGGFPTTPQKKDTQKDEEGTLPPPNKRLCFSQEPSNSGGCAGQEVQEQRPLVRPPEESSGDGTVKQEVQDVEVDPFPDAHSGPSRTTSVDYVPQGTMEKPPNEILQVIFALVPLEHPQCMLGLIRCASAVRTCHCRNPTAVLEGLHSHTLFPKAELCIAKTFPYLDGRRGQPAYVRAVMAAIVLLGGGVCDVQELVGCLQMPENTMLWTNTLEMLYCMATLLYAMRENEVQISNSRPVLQPTREQRKILDHALAPGQRVKIVAFAGTGKTSTLIQYTRKWSKLNFLYLVFNRARARQLSKDFCSNVGFVLSDPDNEFIIKGVIGTLKAFFASADESITVKHIIVEEAKEIWSKMETLDPTLNMAHRVTHDAMMDIILRQKCAVILAGDPHQQIYTFRGADNTGFNVPHSHIFYLTRSFRFGSEIAYIGTTLLDVSKKVRNKTLVGNNQESDVSGVKGKVACLSRTNKSIFDSAVKIIERKSSAKIHFLGGSKSIDLEMIQDLWRLLHPEREFCQLGLFVDVQAAWKGKRFTSIKEYAKEEEDKVLERYIAIVEEYQDIPQLITS
ncbi:hypothetical protein E2320_004387 [Naja naja]|nr:hypothetical protein E2320_004387 [Naja naja]